MMKRVKWDEWRCCEFSYCATTIVGGWWLCLIRAKHSQIVRGEAALLGHSGAVLSVNCQTALAAKRAILKRTRNFLQEALEALA